jgi:pimeloyl-ACP methyl ester carboxylesterase
MPFFRHENIDFYYEDYGSGPAFVFSHGLGNNLAQVRALMGDLPGVRVILYDNRGHGRTSGIVDPARLTFPVMAEDMAALLDHLAVPAAAVGGVSMGAGISMAFCLKNPDRTKALVLSRPAWLNSPEPPNLTILQMIGDLVEKYGPEPAVEHFRSSERYADFESIAPETAKTLVASFTNRGAEATISTYRYIPASVPFHSWEELRSIRAPALVLANRNDPIHPFEYAEQLCSALPHATWREIPSKSESLELHQSRFREYVTEFLRAHM